MDEIRVGRDRTLEIYGILPAREADTELRRPASPQVQYRVGYLLTVSAQALR